VSTIRPRTAATPSSTEDVAEYVAEDIVDVAETGSACAAESAALTVDRIMPEAVVGGPLLIVIEHLVSLLGFLEAILGGIVVGIAIGVVLHREAAIGLLKVIGRRIPADTQDFVVVTLAHSTALFRCLRVNGSRSVSFNANCRQEGGRSRAGPS